MLCESWMGTMSRKTEFKRDVEAKMTVRNLQGGVVHAMPGDLESALVAAPKALSTWEDITPLARNEWICWIESAKKVETRQKRIDWGLSNLADGKRRPCCWPGCSHR
jgi:uncharacterized protein YdeI (YjbR/CyaY-like superfamily)